MKIGDQVNVILNKILRAATFVCYQEDDIVVAIQKGETSEHHRVSAFDVVKYEKCDEKTIQEFHEKNLDSLLIETQDALDALLPGEKVERIYGEHSIISAVWGVRISATTVQVRSIGKIIEKPGWAVSYEHISFGRADEEDFYDVVSVGDYLQNSFAVESFIRCLFERKLENYCENHAF